MAQDPAYDLATYTPAARRFHWLIALLIIAQIPLGLYMVWRGDDMPGVNDKGEPVKGVWNGIADNGLTDMLYNSHKLLGVVLLLLVAGRLFYRLTRGAPPDDPTVPRSLLGISHVTHWALYALMLATPVIGYIATSYYGALDVFGIPFPALTGKDEKFAEEVFELHETAALALALLVLLHIGGALYHRLVRKDRVVERMLPKRRIT